MHITGATAAELALLVVNRDAAVARNTLLGMQRGWERWRAWATPRGHALLPADAEVVERFLVLHLAEERGLRFATIRHTAWAMDATHRREGLAPPGHTPRVRTALQGLRRRLRRPLLQQKPLTIADIAGMRFGASAIDRRDKALLLLGFAAALRRSELVALDVGDVEPRAGGLAVCVRQSKTDQEGAGAWVFVGRSERYPGCCPVDALTAWLAGLPPGDGPLFRSLSRRGEGPRLSGTDVDRVIKKCAARAGLGPGYGGHSLRAGCATWLAECGVPIPVIARHGRWAKLDMVLTYARGDTARALAGVY